MKGALRAAVAAILIVLGSAGPLHAATVKAISGQIPDFDSSSPCNLRLDGEIVRGDLAKVKAARQQVYRWSSDLLGDWSNHSMADIFAAKSPILCLNSTGGSFDEAIRIARYLMTGEGSSKTEYEHEVTTFVDNNAKCYSACAVIFLAGREVGRRSERFPARYLHVGGDLAFQLPSVDPAALADRSRRESAIEANMSRLRTVVEIFEDKGEDIGRALEIELRSAMADLLVAMLKTGPKQLVHVKTLGNAVRWDIQLVGAKRKPLLDPEMFRRVCEETDDDKERPPFKILDPSDDSWNRLSEYKEATAFKSFGEYSSRESLCVVTPSLRWEPEPLEGKQRELYKAKFDIIWASEDAPNRVMDSKEMSGWAIYPPDSPLTDLLKPWPGASPAQ